MIHNENGFRAVQTEPASTRVYKRTVTEPLRALFESQQAYVQWDKQFDRWGGQISFGENVSIEPHTLQARTAGNLYSIGAFSYIQSALPVDTRIGRYCSIAPGVTAMGQGHPTDYFSTSPVFYKPVAYPFAAHPSAVESSQFVQEKWDFLEQRKPITIGNDVWIGTDVVLRDGITVGDGAIIAQGALVTKDVPPYAIVGGVPAKVIRSRFAEDTVQRLLASRWWKYAYTDFAGVSTTDDPNHFLDRVEALEQSGEIVEYTPSCISYADIEAVYAAPVGDELGRDEEISGGSLSLLGNN